MPRLPQGIQFLFVLLLSLAMSMPNVAPRGSAVVVTEDSDGNEHINATFPAEGGDGLSFGVEVPADAYVEKAGFRLAPFLKGSSGSFTDDGAAGFGAGTGSSVNVTDTLTLPDRAEAFANATGFAGAVHNGTRFTNGSVQLIANYDAVLVENGGVSAYSTGELTAVAVGSNNYVHVVFMGAAGSVEYVRSTDGGTSWSAPSTITTPPTSPTYIALYISPLDKLHLFVSWSLMGGVGKAYFHSGDNGTTWSSRSLNGGLSSSYDIRVAWGPDGTMHALGMLMMMGTPPWPYYLKYFNSTDGGLTWTGAICVNDSAKAHATEYDLDVDPAGVVHLVWGDQRDAVAVERSIYYANSTDDFSNRQLFGGANVDCRCPRIAADDAMVHIAWTDDGSSGTDHVRYMNSSDDGGAFVTPKRINALPGSQDDLEMELNATGAVQLVWTQGISPAPCTDLCHSESTDGTTFSAPRKLDPNGLGNQSCPSLDIGPAGTPHVAFFDDRSGNHIYHVKADPNYLEKGSVRGKLDLGAVPAALLSFRANDSAGAYTHIDYELASSHNGNAWSGWEAVSSPDTAITTPPQRYVRWRANLSTDDPLDTPTLAGLEVTAGFFETSGSFLSRWADAEGGGAVSGVKLEAEGELDGCAFRVSADNGTTWQDATPGEWVDTGGGGSQPRYDVILSGPGNSTPVVRSVTLNWSSGAWPVDVMVDLGDDEAVDYQCDGEMTVPAAMDLTQELRAAQVAGSPTSFPVTVTAVGGGLNVSGIEIALDLKPVIDDYRPEEAVVTEGGFLLFNVTAHDPDGKELEHLWFLEAKQVSDTDSFNYTPSYNIDGGEHGDAHVRVEVSDGRFTVVHHWQVLVLDDDRPPIIEVYSPRGDVVLEWDKSATLSISASDPDGHDLEFRWVKDGESLRSDGERDPDGGRRSRWTSELEVSSSNLDMPGVYNITAVAGNTLEAAHTWSVTLRPPALRMTVEPANLTIALGSFAYVNLSFTPHHIQDSNVTVSVDPETFCSGGTFALSEVAVLNFSAPSDGQPGIYEVNITAEADMARAWAILVIEVVEGGDGGDGGGGDGSDGDGGGGGDGPGGDKGGGGGAGSGYYAALVAAVVAVLVVVGFISVLFISRKKRKAGEKEASTEIQAEAPDDGSPRPAPVPAPHTALPLAAGALPAAQPASAREAVPAQPRMATVVPPQGAVPPPTPAVVPRSPR